MQSLGCLCPARLGALAVVLLGWVGYSARRRGTSAASADAILAALAEPTPSARDLRPDDVLGRWQFYVDAAASTVTVDLQPDGRYIQHDRRQ